MKKVSLIGTWRYPGIILIAMQGILFVLLAIFKLNDTYLERWSQYGEIDNTFSIYLENISEDYSDELERYLYTETADNRLYIIRRESLLARDGAFEGYAYGVYGDYENNDVGLSFCGKEIVSKEMISDLLKSQEEHATLGIEQGSEYCIKDIPKFRLGEKFVIKKLPTMISDSGTIQGQYLILGASQKVQGEIISQIADICGIEKEQLLKSLHGENLDNSLKRLVLIIFIAAQIILNFIYFLLIAIRNLDKKGKLALMGWSGTEICYELFHCFIWYAILMIPLLIIAGDICSGWTEFLETFIVQFFAYSVLNLILVIIEICLASLVQLSVKSLDAIKGKFPKKVLYLFGITGYIGISIAITACGIYIDSPINYMNENAKISKNWSQVSDYQILKSISVGNDESSFSGTSNRLNQDIYNWYCDISDNAGVYLINTTYYDDAVLTMWRNSQIYDCVPEESFWYFTFSPSYIRDIGLKIDETFLEKAEKGTRIYMIPAGLDSEEKESICVWLTETAEEGIKESDIATEFNKNREVELIEYDAESDFFTWSTEAEGYSCSMPIIYICTPANMKYFESESLRAVGLDGYIKFRNFDTAQKCLSRELLESYNLADNNLQFTDVGNYVDGLQKELLQTVMWFGVVFVILVAILIGIMLALATVYRIANEEILNVQKFLGYGFFNMYGKLMSGLGIINVGQLLTMFLVRSRFGLVAIAIVIIMQWIIFWKYMTRLEVQNIVQAFKER